MNCPVCKTDLKIADRQGIEVDYCPQCRGVWLDRGELDKIIDRALGEIGGGQSQPASRVHLDGDGDDDHRDHDHDDHDDNDQRYRGQHKSRRRKSLLGELFDF